MPAGQFLSLARVAEILGLDRSTVYRMVARGDLATYRVGRQIRVLQEDLDAYLEKHRAPCADERSIDPPGRTSAPRVWDEDGVRAKALAAARRFGWTNSTKNQNRG